MKKSTLPFVAALLAVSASSSFAADRVLTCAVNRFGDWSGIRVNIIHSQGRLKATIFEGPTMNSGGTYWIEKTSRGYEGADRTGKRKFSLTLTTLPAQNNYIKGVQAKVSAVRETQHGDKTISADYSSDRFVCGKQIKPYND